MESVKRKFFLFKLLFMVTANNIRLSKSWLKLNSVDMVNIYLTKL